MMVLRVQRVIGLTIALFAVLLIVFLFIQSRPTEAAINQEINFQGKLTNPDGTNVTDGNYSLRFRIYTASTGDTGSPCLSTCLWEETQGTVAVDDGIFRVALGSVTSLPGSVDFNTSSLYLSVKIGADPEMTPRIRFTSSPYAFNSDRLGGLTSTSFVQLAQGVQTDSSTTNASIAINKTGGTALIFDLQRSGASVLQVANNGSALFQNQADSATGFRVLNQSALPLLVINTTTNNIHIGNPTADSTGSQLVVDSKNTAGDPTGVNGGVYYNSSTNRFRCFQNSVWSDCLSSASSHATLTSGLANVAASSTGAVLEEMVFTSATGVSNTAGTTGFVAPAGGSFRTCLVRNNAAITAGTLSLRWRVNGASVGATACNMDATASRESATALDPGVVTFTQGDTIGIAFDTNAGFLPTGTNDFTVYWSVEYNSTTTAVSGATLQSAYGNGDTINTTDTHDLVINATDTSTDANILVNLQCVTSCVGNGRFAVQTGGTDRLTVSPDGAVTIAGGAASSFTTTAGGLTLQAATTNTLTLNTGGAGTVNVGTTNSTTVALGSTGAGFSAESNTATTALFNGATAHTIQLATGAAAQIITIGSTNTTSALTLNAGSGNLAINATSGTVTLQTTTAGAINIRPVSIDGTNIVLGTSDTVGTLLILDTKTGTGDPTGVNGGMYYNSATGDFRCYADSDWKNCDKPSLRQGWFMYDDFATATITAGTAADLGNIGESNWTFLSVGAGGTLTKIDVGAVANDQGRFGIQGLNSPATNNIGGVLRLDNTSINGVPGDMTVEFAFTATTNTTNQILRLGLHDETTTTQPVDGIYFQYNVAGAAGNWFRCTRNNNTETCTDTGIAIAAVGTYQRFKIATNTAGTQVDFYINEASAGANTTNLPAATRSYGPAIYWQNTTAAARVWKIDYYQLHRTNITR